MNMLLLFLLVGVSPDVSRPAPDTLSLVYCYERIHEHYPLARKMELQQEITDLRTRLATTGYYPQIVLGGTASYQSEVTRLPAGPGGVTGPALSKDQYRVSLEINQPIYTGGAIGLRKQLEQVQGRQELLSTEVQLHELRSQIDEVYFGILLARQQSRTVELLMENLKRQLESVEARVRNGVALPSQRYVLLAELANARQDSAEIQSTLRAGVRVLGELIGLQLPPDIQLKLPEVSYERLVDMEPHRPEYDLFENGKSALQVQKKLVNSRQQPSVSAFGNLSYGRPGYNFFNDDFHEFYMVGVRVKWNFWDWNNGAEEQQILSLQQQQIDEDRQAFSRQLSSALSRIEEQIASLQQQIAFDEQVVALRQRVVNETESQLNNGVLTATEYVTELNRANQAQLALYARRVQLSQMIMRYATTKGIPVESLNPEISNNFGEQ